MIVLSQRNLAILAALVCISLFIAANAHLVVVAVTSQPECTVSVAKAAKPAC